MFLSTLYQAVFNCSTYLSRKYSYFFEYLMRICNVCGILFCGLAYLSVTMYSFSVTHIAAPIQCAYTHHLITKNICSNYSGHADPVFGTLPQITEVDWLYFGSWMPSLITLFSIHFSSIFSRLRRVLLTLALSVTVGLALCSFNWFIDWLLPGHCWHLMVCTKQREVKLRQTSN